MDLMYMDSLTSFFCFKLISLKYCKAEGLWKRYTQIWIAWVSLSLMLPDKLKDIKTILPVFEQILSSFIILGFETYC